MSRDSKCTSSVDMMPSRATLVLDDAEPEKLAALFLRTSFSNSDMSVVKTPIQTICICSDVLKHGGFIHHKESARVVSSSSKTTL